MAEAMSHEQSAERAIELALNTDSTAERTVRVAEAQTHALLALAEAVRAGKEPIELTFGAPAQLTGDAGPGTVHKAGPWP